MLIISPDVLLVFCFLETHSQILQPLHLDFSENAGCVVLEIQTATHDSFHISYKFIYFPDEEENDDELLKHADLTAAQAAIEKPMIMKLYVGEGASTFITDYGPSGVYTLMIKAIEDDTSVRIYATTTPYSDHPYPELPLDANVDIVSNEDEAVTLMWKPSPTNTAHDIDVQYCVMANRKRNFQSMCGAEAFMNGEVPPTAPPHSGFGFAWEQDKNRKFKSQLHPKMASSPQDVTLLFIGQKTSYTFHNLKQGEQYFFDVFVVNPRNNRSSAYNGTSAVTKSNLKTETMKEKKLMNVFIKRNSGRKLFKFEQVEFSKELIISVLPCFGEFNVKVSRRGRVVATGTVSELENFRIHKAKKGTYMIDVSTIEYRSGSLQLFISTKSKDLPYPELPKDRRIKVFQNKRSCDTITVAWLGTRRKVQYCLYAKPIAAISQFLPWTTFTDSNKCISPSSRKKAEKVMCKTVRYKNKRRAVMTEVVSGLKPHTKYNFDVYATLPGTNGQTLSYESTSIVTSSSKC